VERVQAGCFRVAVTSTEITLGRAELIPEIPYPRHSKKLPTVLRHEEIARLLHAVRQPKYHAVLATIYAAGLRISEALSLKVSDIDSERMVITVCGRVGRTGR
jgi:integrase/recombinase XerD